MIRVTFAAATAAAAIVVGSTAAPVAVARTSASCDAPSWVAAWALPVNNTNAGYNDQTVRVVVPPGFGGDRVRVGLSNALGTEPLTVRGAHVGVAATGAAVEPGTQRPLTFAGGSTVTIAPEGSALSDPVGLRVEAFEPLAVSFYAPAPTGPASGHGALATTFVADGDHAADESADAFGSGANGSRIVTGVDVFAPNDGAIAAFGDSITEGFGTGGVQEAGGGNPYTETLAQRLVEQAGGPRVSLVNLGISGNRITGDGTGPSAVKRLRRDVLDQSGLAGVLMMEGINDIGPGGGSTPPAVDAFVAAYTDIIGRVRAADAAMWLSPLTPAGDLERPTPFGHSSTPERIERRHEVNDWIRRRSGVYDPRADFEQAVKDPQKPNWIALPFDFGDNLHPNSEGAMAMAESIDLAIFDRLKCTAPQSAPDPQPPATTTPPAAPPPAAPPPASTTPAPATTAGERIAGRLVARVSPSRDRRRPYAFTTTGRLALPAGTQLAQACRDGIVAIQVKAGRNTLSTRRTPLRADCTFRSRVSFSQPRRFAGRRTLMVRARFLGTPAVRPAAAPARRVGVR